MTARLGVEVLSARGRRRKSRIANTLRAVNARVSVLSSESDPRGSGSYIALVKRPLGERMRNRKSGSVVTWDGPQRSSSGNPLEHLLSHASYVSALKRIFPRQPEIDVNLAQGELVESVMLPKRTNDVHESCVLLEFGRRELRKTSGKAIVGEHFVNI